MPASCPSGPRTAADALRSQRTRQAEPRLAAAATWVVRETVFTTRSGDYLSDAAVTAQIRGHAGPAIRMTIDTYAAAGAGELARDTLDWLFGGECNGVYHGTGRRTERTGVSERIR